MPEQFAHEAHTTSGTHAIRHGGGIPNSGAGYNQFDYLPMGLQHIAEASVAECDPRPVVNKPSGHVVSKERIV
jgi:hypothetical protein